MVESLPGFLLKSPDANVAVTASAIGGMMEGLRKASAAKAREAFTDMFRFSEAPYTAITTFDKERRRNVTHTTHLDIPDEELADVDPKSLYVATPRGLLLSVGSARDEGMNIPMDELVVRLAEIPDGTDITVVGDSPDDAMRAARFLLFRGFEPGRILVLR